ncbi:MAG: dCTP deaminase [Minisyncoccia bacterium]
MKPFPDFSTQLGPASLDIRLGQEFRIFNSNKKPFIDPKDPESFLGLTKLVKIKEGEKFILHPREFVLGVTYEEIHLPADIGARIEGRSSWGRLGLIIHSTAGYIDPGFKGKLTLEISNIGNIPIVLYSKIKICQLAFEILSSPAKIPYSERKNSKYGGKHVQESKIHLDFKKK